MADEREYGVKASKLEKFTRKGVLIEKCSLFILC